MRRVVWLLWLFCLAGWAGAEEATLRISTSPPGAKVYVVRRGGLRNDDGGADLAELVPPYFNLDPGEVAGSSGEPLNVKIPTGQSELTVVLLHRHCEPDVQRLDLKAARAKQARILDFPLDGGTYRLRYRSTAHRLKDLGERHLPWLAAVAGLGVLLLGLQIRHNLQVKALAEKAREEDRRASMITSMVVKGEYEDPLLGAVLDEYRILERLGEGGMAKVYRAIPDRKLEGGQPVAIKLLSMELARDPEVVRRFDRERQVYDMLLHPNIVRVLGSGVYQQQYYLVMELIRGETLRKQVVPGGQKPSRVLRMMTPVLEAVAFANKKGIVHRDLKPENIMLTRDGIIKVMDFGLARGSNFSRVTATGAILGTPAYMAPEQIQGDVDPRTDQYALGVILYELLCGELPFFDENPMTLVMKHITAPVPLLGERNPELARTDKVIGRMLAKEPGDRFRDLEQALVQLRHVLL